MSRGKAGKNARFGGFEAEVAFEIARPRLSRSRSYVALALLCRARAPMHPRASRLPPFTAKLQGYDVFTGGGGEGRKERAGNPAPRRGRVLSALTPVLTPARIVAISLSHLGG